MALFNFYYEAETTGGLKQGTVSVSTEDNDTRPELEMLEELRDRAHDAVGYELMNADNGLVVLDIFTKLLRDDDLKETA